MSKSAISAANRTSWWWASLALVVFLIVGVGTVLLQKELRRSQENRGQAAVANGIVEIGHDTSMVLSKNKSVILLGVNTHDAVVKEIRLAFDVLAPTSATAPATLSPNAIVSTQNANLVHVHSDIGLIAQPTTENMIGWRVNVTLGAADQAAGFTTGQLTQSLLRFDFTLPETDGQLQVKFDQASAGSHALLWSANAGTDTDILKTIPAISLEIYNEDCQYTYSDWGSCSSTTAGTQTRTYTAAGTQCPLPHSAMLSQKCFATPPQCEYVYTDWSACTNGHQTRAYSERAQAGSVLVNNNPSICYFYNSVVLQPLSQECQMPVVDTAPTQGFATYTYETCWNDRSEGTSTYIIWDKAAYPSATKIDVSTTSDFKSYATKTVTGATNALDNNYLATDGTNFRTYTDGKNSPWVFWPGYTYYFRMYYGSNQHTGVISYFVPKCAGVGGVSYKQCNESCSANKDCASNLSCVSGVCRRADNASSNICATPPDKGLQRACNDYCSDSSECRSGLTCWWNRCRAPKNLDNTSCATPQKTSAVYYNYSDAGMYKGGVVVAGSADAAPASTTPESSCNERCSTNRDCAANLRCFQGSCRLPSNVTNLSCMSVAEVQAATKSGIVQVPTEDTQVAAEPIIEQPIQENTTLAQWLVSRLGYLLVGLLVAVAILLIWPLLRPRAQTPTKLTMTSVSPTYRSYPTPNAPANSSNAGASTSSIQQPINQMMTPPRQEP